VGSQDGRDRLEGGCERRRLYKYDFESSFDFRMDIGIEKQYLINQIRQNADSGYQKALSRGIPTSLKVYGLRVVDIRKITRTWQRAHQAVSPEDLLSLVEAMWDGESREERMVALELLQQYPRWIPDLTWARFECWRRDLDNWELTDVLGVAVLGPWVLGDPDTRAEHLWDLVADEDVWSRRLALVSTIGLNRARKNVSFPALTLELIDQVKEERHPMISKAVSWMLRDMIKEHPDQVVGYLDENRDVLAAQVVREVSNKLKTGLKSGKIQK
jgi:3-methyladenine DNA glycosylase AlkD